MSIFENDKNIQKIITEDMIDLTYYVEDDDYRGLGRIVFSSLQMEEHLRKSSDPDSLLGFKEMMASAGLGDRIPIDAAKLPYFLEIIL